MITLCAVVLSLHFGRVLAGNLYRAAPAFVLPAARLAEMLGKTRRSTQIQEDGSVEDVLLPDEDAITRFERCKFYLHCLLAN